MHIKGKYNGTILSLDIVSQKTGYAIYKDDRIIKSGTWKLNPKTKYADLHKKITQTIEANNVSQIVAEDIFNDNERANVFQVLAECRGVVECISQQYKLPISFIRPITAKNR